MTYTLQSKISELLKDKKAVEVVEKYAPGISKNPLIALVRGKTLEKLLEMPQAKSAGLTREMVDKILGEINLQK